VIAIVVALSVSTFILGFAALAIDLGSAYVRKAELQSIANRLALAGARGLPVVVQPDGALDQIDDALQGVCQSNPIPGVCVIAADGTGRAPNRSWMVDENPANGEVAFFSDPDGDTRYNPVNRVADLALATVATALQVRLPPSTVTFGLAGAIGVDSATLTRTATGRVGTPLGSGMLPFALQPADLTAGQFCVHAADPPQPPVGQPPDPCQQPTSERGFAQLARPTAGSVLEDLEQNIRSGPATNLLPTDGPLGSIGSALDCVSATFAAATSCLVLTPDLEFENALTQGLLGPAGNTPGRLIGDCGNGTTSSEGITGIDDSRLFDDPGFIDPRQGGSASALRDRLFGLNGPTAAGPQNRGWLTSKLLQCPRLAVLPVIDPDSIVGGLGVLGAKNITGFSYVWIDDDGATSERGLHWADGELDSFRGFVLDPGYLPAVVSGSTLVGPFLGGNMPKQVLLIPDLGGSER
jgi:hypothetical protein